MKTPQTWPAEIKQGSVTVKIYRLARGKYLEFRVSHYGRDGKRQIKTFADYGKAHRHANTVAAGMANGDASTVTLAGGEAGSYLRARATLDPLKVTLDAAAADYARAITRLDGRPLSEVVDFYVTNCAALKTATVGEVVAELVDNRRNPPGGRRARTEKYLKDMGTRLGRFADYAKVPIASVGPAEIRTFLASLDGGACTRWNYLRLIRTLFLFAKSRRYYPRSVDPFEDGLRDEFAYVDESEIEIWTPAELSKFLEVARPEMIPFLAIGAFAGLRTAEIERLDWADIKAGHIEITRGKAKTRSRRLVPIPDNLQAWLAPHRRESGKVWTFVHTARQLMFLADKAGIPWRHNALRHSFISYRMAATNDENLVASEAGNSPGMIHGHYRELVSKADAAAWFAIVPPDAAENVVPMHATG